MRNILIILIAFSLFSCSNNENKSAPPKTPIDSLALLCKQDPNCQYFAHTAEFPFDEEIAEVVLVSYEHPRSSLVSIYDSIVVDDALTKNGEIIFTQFSEEIVLDTGQINYLRRILSSMNGGIIVCGNLEEGYCPSHCIFFKDKNKKTLGYFEFYLERHMSRTDLPHFYISTSAQYKALALFFKKCGIKKGLDFDINKL